MLLRRITEHVETQNWTAIGIDFFIVVMGVFIGIQVANWNDASQARRDYQEAVIRFEDEMRANIESLDQVNMEAAAAMKVVTDAYTALNTCIDTADNREIVERGLVVISGTYGAGIRDEALRQLLENNRLLAQQSPEERGRYADIAFSIKLFTREVDYIETIPLRTQVHEIPIVAFGERTDRTVTYHGEDYSRSVFSLKLTVPLNEACKNKRLNSQFYSWIRWQGVLPVVSKILTDKFEDALKEK